MIDERIARYYIEFNEDARLSDAIGQLEFVRTMELLERHLPPPPARVLDVGGATGPYSEALGRRGYETHLLDAMETHVEQARRRAAIASVTVGDARELPWPDQHADVVLLMGPLYHLNERADRAAALLEARRVLKPGGRLAAAAISRFASLLDGLQRCLMDDARFRQIVLRDLECGQHRNSTERIDYFTTAYFHLPEQLQAELKNAGFTEARVFPVEGVVCLAPDLEACWADKEKREFLLEVIRRTEAEPSLAGAGSHLMAFARAPEQGPIV